MDENNQVIKCPQCGSTNIHFATKTNGGGYSLAKGCLGGLICLPGVLCGLNKTTSETVRKCMNCGKEF